MKVVLKYLKDRETALNILLQKPGNKFTVGTFHKLRVEIKKLKALFELIDYSSSTFKKSKTFKPFKQIFKQAGKVRELQIEDGMLKKYLSHRLLKNYQRYLKRLQLKEQKLFFALLVKIPSNHFKLSFREIHPFLNEVSQKKASAFINKKTKKITNLLHQINLLEPQLHDLRKRIKTINYLRKGLLSGKLDKAILKEDPLPELLGKWHDSRITIGHLKKTMSVENLNPKETKQLEKIIAGITATSQALFDKIKKAMPASDFY